MPQSLIHCLMVVLCASLAGCGWWGSKPAPKNVSIPLSATAQARKDLTAIAKKIEDPAAYEAMETYIKSFEDPEQKWTWADLDDVILRGGYTQQTKEAYDKWRNATIKERAKR